jgi:hypothetical protein
MTVGHGSCGLPYDKSVLMADSSQPQRQSGGAAALRPETSPDRAKIQKHHRGCAVLLNSDKTHQLTHEMSYSDEWGNGDIRHF